LLPPVYYLCIAVFHNLGYIVQAASELLRETAFSELCFFFQHPADIVSEERHQPEAQKT